MLGQSWMFLAFVASGLLLVAVSMWPSGPERVEPAPPTRRGFPVPGQTPPGGER